MATNTSDFFTFSKTAGTAKNLQKPTDGGDNNLWGGYINVDLDTIVGAVNATSDLIADANQNELVDFTATGSAVNHVGITNAATGNGPTIEAKGDDSNVDLNVKPKGTGAILLKDGDGNELVKTSRTASAVNEITVANAATGNGPTLSATGDDTNIDLNVSGKGSGALTSTGAKLTSPKVITGVNDTNGNELIKVTATGSAVNEITVSNSATGNPPEIQATGDDTNISLKLTPKGTGDLTLTSGNLVIGTAGKGIDFSVNSHQSGMTSELLSSYEEGTFSLGNTKSFASQTCLYTRIGRYVFICGTFANSSGGVMNSTFTNLPFTVANSDGAESGGVVTWHNENAPGSVGNYKLYPHKNTTTFQVYAEGSGTTISGTHEFSSDRTVRFFLNYLTS